MITESFELTVDDHVAALQEIAALRAVEVDVGPLGRLQHGTTAVVRWGFRVAAIGLPLIVAMPLLALPGLRMLGFVVLAIAPVLLLVVLGFERLGEAALRRMDSVGDGLIDRALAGELRAAIERGDVRVLLGLVDARLDEGRLVVRSAEHEVAIADVRAAWRHGGGPRLLIAPRAPSCPAALAGLVPLPANGPVAAALLTLDPRTTH